MPGFFTAPGSWFLVYPYNKKSDKLIFTLTMSKEIHSYEY